MKKELLILLAFMAIALGSQAQVLMNTSDFTPSIGDTYILHTIDYIDPGKNVIWDLSEVAIRSSNAVEIIEPSSSPFGDSFQNSELCYDLGNGEYMYYSLDSAVFANTGGIAEGSLIRHDKVKTMLRFPIESSDRISENYTSSFSVDGVQFRRNGEIDMNVIGEGTAIFPFGIMDNVIKIRVQENISDRYQVMGQDAEINSSLESYYFIAPGSNEFIMSLHIQEQEGKELNRFGTLLDKGDLQSMLVMNAPLRAIHPATTSTSLDLKMIAEWNGELHISLQDLKGKEAIEPVTVDVIAGKVETALEWNSLESGTYIMNLELDDRLSQLKVVKD